MSLFLIPTLGKVVGSHANRPWLLFTVEVSRCFRVSMFDEIYPALTEQFVLSGKVSLRTFSCNS